MTGPRRTALGDEKRRVQPAPRRTFLRYGLIGGTTVGLGAFGLAALAQLWPELGEGFGAEFALPDAEAILARIRDERAPFAWPSGRLYVIAWEPRRPGATNEYSPDDHVVLDDDNGLMALDQKCPHLGCRVPWCRSSQWFECPCHGSKYNRWGEWMQGPAPRGMDRFPSRIDDNGNLVIDTGVVLTGPARTARVLQQGPEGAHCIDL